MNRLSSCLLGLVLAAWGTACVTKEGPTAPEPPVAAGPPTRWTGTAIFTREGETQYGSSKQRLDLEVTWVKAENPNPAPLPGTTRYVPSGRVHARLQSNLDAGGTCTVDREGDFPIEVPDDPLITPDQFLDLGPDGQYQGRVYGSWVLDYVQFCRDRAVAYRTVVWMDLDIRGTLDGGRMHGSMPPKVIADSLVTSTRTGSWSFTAN